MVHDMSQSAWHAEALAGRRPVRVAGHAQVGARQWERVLDMVGKVRGLGLEVCTTLGMLTPTQAQQLATAGLTAYNHNLDTSPEYYGQITSSRKYEVCCSCMMLPDTSEPSAIKRLWEPVLVHDCFCLCMAMTELMRTTAQRIAQLPGKPCPTLTARMWHRPLVPCVPGTSLVHLQG